MAEAVHIRFGVACRYACRPICDGHPRCRDVLLRLQLARSRSRGLETSGMIYYVVRTVLPPYTLMRCECGRESV